MTSKKGNAVADGLLVTIFVVVFAIVSIIGFKAFNELNDDMVVDPDIDSASYNVTAGELHDRYPSLFDALIVFFIALLAILVVVASFMIDSHPIFFVVTFILMIFVLIVGVLVGNAFEEIMDDPDLSTVASSFPMTYFLLTHMLQLGLVIGFSIMLALFAKNRVGS